MDKQNAFIILAGLFIVVGYVSLKNSEALPIIQYVPDNSNSIDNVNGGVAAPASTGGNIISNIAHAIGKAVMNTFNSGWSVDKIPPEYADAISQSEINYGLPENLLARLLWQESRYRPDIINGATVSPAGALGIAQFMPATAEQFGINPLDPFQSIAAAAKYLHQLFRMFGDWPRAVAAYNWGQGNVARKGLKNAPTETKNYYTQILSDIGLA